MFNKLPKFKDRKKQATDYAKCNGIVWYEDEKTNACWLRSCSTNNYDTMAVFYDCSVYNNVCETSIGVVPVINIKMEED